MIRGPRVSFDDLYVKTSCGCWIWLGYETGTYTKYGVYYYEGAHRFSFNKHVGPIPDDMCVLHKCNIGMCVNPEHLYLGDRGQNNLDRYYNNPESFSMRPLKTHCKRGHPLVPGNIDKGRRCMTCKRQGR
jgi:HNH endonuclease